MPADGQQGNGLIGRQLPEYLGIQHLFFCPARGFGFGTRAVGAAPALFLRAARFAECSTGNFHLVRQGLEILQGVQVFGAKAQLLAKVLAQGIRQIAIAQRSVKAGDGLRGDNANGFTATGLIPKIEIAQAVLIGADDLLELVTEEEYRAQGRGGGLTGTVAA